MDSKATTVPVAATLTKGFGRDAGWTATLVGAVQGYGKTQGEAKQALSERVTSLALNASFTPTVVRDDLGQVWIFSPFGDGVLGTLVREDGMSAHARLSYSEGTPEQAAERMVKAMPGSVRLA